MKCTVSPSEAAELPAHNTSLVLISAELEDPVQLESMSGLTPEVEVLVFDDVTGAEPGCGLLDGDVCLHERALRPLRRTQHWGGGGVPHALKRFF